MDEKKQILVLWDSGILNGSSIQLLSLSPFHIGHFRSPLVCCLTPPHLLPFLLSILVSLPLPSSPLPRLMKNRVTVRIFAIYAFSYVVTTVNYILLFWQICQKGKQNLTTKKLTSGVFQSTYRNVHELYIWEYENCFTSVAYSNIGTQLLQSNCNETCSLGFLIVKRVELEEDLKDLRASLQEKQNCFPH